MKESVIHFQRGGPLLALVGNPNCGKTALFNLLTGSRQKVANYAGVTVERKEGKLTTPAGKALRVLDLPGTYSLVPRSPDERVTHDVLYGRAAGEKRPDLVVCVVDATNLRRTLRLVLAVKRAGLRCVVALNMADLAKARGLNVDVEKLQAALGVPVVETIATQRGGDAALRALIASLAIVQAPHLAPPTANFDSDSDSDSNQSDAHADHHTVAAILNSMGLDAHVPHLSSDKIDRWVLHPVWGMALLLVTLFIIFQAVFSLATVPMDGIKAGTAWLGQLANNNLPDQWWRGLLVDGIIAGLGGVIVFLPQILILFFFILLLEESGYLPRAAFLLDRLMGAVGLSGRSFIPLLSSFACAIPGIMAARTIANQRDRIVTIMLAPLMTCSARLPVYALIIGAFIPAKTVAGFLSLQGLVLLALYVAGIVGAMTVAWLLKRFTSAGRSPRPLMMELPSYHWPTVRGIALGLWQRTQIFLRRVGGIILLLTIALWFLASYPTIPEGSNISAIEYSFAGRIGHFLSIIFAPIGFNWQICIALVPGMAAREVAVSSLATVYAISATAAAGSTGAAVDVASTLTPIIANQWSLATALSLLAWFVFAPQCLSTIATVKRETGGWKMPLIMLTYLFSLAYVAAFITYRIALALGA